MFILTVPLLENDTFVGVSQQQHQNHAHGLGEKKRSGRFQ